MPNELLLLRAHRKRLQASVFAQDSIEVLPFPQPAVWYFSHSLRPFV
ncbi:uncharacterized protein METZ01_LOCUS493758 [marine metagenome]|uniref:Uncharacterized protein n=1 Tax=marine metagenome TaxID=408172 RepID=A0A383D9A7_9ZZZZ